MNKTSALRIFFILIAKDDFSAANPIAYKSASVNGKEIDMTEIDRNIQEGAKLLMELQYRCK